MSITKIHAHIAAAYDYKMVDKEGKKYRIISVHNGEAIKILDLDAKERFLWVTFGQIGTEYFFLCRPLSDLVKEIDEKVPLVELAKVAYRKVYKYLPEEELVINDYKIQDVNFGDMVRFEKDGSYFKFIVETQLGMRAGFYLIRDNDFNYYLDQLALFQKLYKMHFDLFPEGTTKPITN